MILKRNWLKLNKSDYFWVLLNNAANFAFANRMFLGLMIQMALQEVLGEFEFNLLYDSPHNLIWKNEINKDLYLHRKGSCSSKGMAQMMETNLAV